MKTTYAWPNQAQLTLLKAALLPPDKAEPYWYEFIADYDLQKLDHGCNQVLPMVFINLKGRLRSDLNERTCRSSYRYVWANNHLIMHDAKALLILLKQHDLKVCLLKGAAFIGHYYPDYGMRIMADIDLLVSPKQMPELVNIIESNGYKIISGPGEADTSDFLKLFHAQSFKNSRGTDFDIHHYVSNFLVNEEFTERIWQNVKAIDLFGIEHLTYVLNPTYQLLHTVLHGLQYAPESSIRWIVDAANLLKNNCDEINWNEMGDICSKHHLNLPMKMALNFLCKELKLPIPQDAISHFNDVKITNRDKDYFVRSSNLGFRNTITRIRRSWEHYKIYSSGDTKKTSLIGFFDFLLAYLKVNSRWALLPHIAKKFSGVLWRAIEGMFKRVFSN